MEKKRLPFSLPLDQQTIQKQRAIILGNLLAMDRKFCEIPVKGIATSTLDAMLKLYDELFLAGSLSRMGISVTLSSRLTSSAGKFLYVRGMFGRI